MALVILLSVLKIEFSASLLTAKGSKHTLTIVILFQSLANKIYEEEKDLIGYQVKLTLTTKVVCRTALATQSLLNTL